MALQPPERDKHTQSELLEQTMLQPGIVQVPTILPTLFSLRDPRGIVDNNLHPCAWATTTSLIERGEQTWQN